MISHRNSKELYQMLSYALCKVHGLVHIFTDNTVCLSRPNVHQNTLELQINFYSWIQVSTFLCCPGHDVIVNTLFDVLGNTRIHFIVKS